MQIRARSTSRDDLLGCRAATLGLDLSAIESRGGEMVEAARMRGTFNSRQRFPLA